MKLTSIEIFATGSWRGNKKITVTEADLDQMVASFDALGARVSGFRPPVKLGHSNEVGGMAYGWVERIWKMGNKILADIVDVPDWLEFAIKERRYDSVSIEMYPSLDYEGKTFQNVLSAVAVLGSELPAVKGLKPLSESLFSDKGEAEVLSKEEDAMFTQEQVDTLIDAAVAKAKAEFKSAGEAEVAALTAKVTDAETKLSEANQRIERADAALAVFKSEAADREINEFIDGAIREGKVLPKQKDALVAMSKTMSGTVKFADKDATALDVLKSFINDAPVKVDLSEKGGAAAKKEKRADLELDKRAKDEMSKDAKLTYSLAVEKVLAGDPALKAAYFSEV